MKKTILTKDYCAAIALKYKYKKDLYTNNNSVYLKMSRCKWIDELCQHMIIIGNKYKRCIYACEFEDSCVYIGLTYNLEKRNNEHQSDKKKSSVYEHMQLSNMLPKFIQLTDYIDVNIAKIKENEYVEKYRTDGWKILNKSKTGAIGTNEKWTKEKCKEEALKYNNRTDFQKLSIGAYSRAQKNNWLNDICSHMKSIKKPNNFFDKYENCLNEVVKVGDKTKFQKSRAYRMSLKNEWLNEIYIELNWKECQKPLGYWNNYENCLNEAIKQKTPTNFILSGGAYLSSKKNGWLVNIYDYMVWKRRKKRKNEIKFLTPE